MRCSASTTKSLRRTADALTKAQVAVYPVEAGGLKYSLDDASSISRETNMRDAKHATQDQITDLQNDSVKRDADHTTMDELARDTGGRSFLQRQRNRRRTDPRHRRRRALLHTRLLTRKQEHGRPISPHPGENGARKIQAGLSTRLQRRGREYPTAHQKQAADPLQPLMAPGMPNFAQIIYLMSVLP